MTQFRVPRRAVLAASWAVSATSATSTAAAQVQGPAVLSARHAAPAVNVKAFHTAGSLTLVGWDRDSILVRGRVARGDRFYLAGSDSGVKFGVENRSARRDDGRA